MTTTTQTTITITTKENKENKENNGNKYKLHTAVCKVSGLVFGWYDETGVDIRGIMQIHPLFKGSNFLAMEGLVIRKEWENLSGKIIAGMILYRLMKWKVLSRNPGVEVLKQWNNMLGEYDIEALGALYETVLELHGTKETKGEFQFNIEGISTVHNLVHLIKKCNTEQSIREKEENIKRELQEEERKAIFELDRKVRQVRVESLEVTTEKLNGVLGMVERSLFTENSQYLKAWKVLRKEIMNDSLIFMDVEKKERAIAFLRWGLIEKKIGSKMEARVRKYVNYVLESDNLWKEFED